MSDTIFLPSEIIKKKRNGLILNHHEIEYFIKGYTNEKIPDYQMAAFLMAVFFKGMNSSETLSLTNAMLYSGTQLSFSKFPFYVDKHSTGGVGDKTSLILAPLVASLGIPVPMISGRGLGHSGGTLDKLESIPGFNVNLNLDQFKQMVDTNKLCFIGQTQEICPADKKIYALRDVTATVESLPLICASIMSKKLAEGIDGIVLDVKCGSGAFMKDLNQAEALAKGLVSIAQGAGKKVSALITNMNSPLGCYAGNALEVLECLEILSGKSKLREDQFDLYSDTRELSLQLASYMIHQALPEVDLPRAYQQASSALTSGKAYHKFLEIVSAQGGNIDKLPKPNKNFKILARDSGYIYEMNTEMLGIAGIYLKAGRAQSSDLIDPVAGIEFHYKPGDAVKKNQPLFTLWGSDTTDFKRAAELCEECYSISLQKPYNQDLILKILN